MTTTPAYTILIPTINWKKVPKGAKIKCKINKKPVEGRITIENQKIFVCHNIPAFAGASPKNRLGYNFGWTLDSKVTDIELTPPEKNYKIPEVLEIAGYTPIIEKGRVKFGCKTVSNTTIRKLVKLLKD